jgi:hypothetical protein
MTKSLTYYIAEFEIYHKFYSEYKMNNLKRKNSNAITLYIINTKNAQKELDQFDIDNSLRSFDISIETLRKHGLNHLFITKDTILFEHDSYYSN